MPVPQILYFNPPGGSWWLVVLPSYRHAGDELVCRVVGTFPTREEAEAFIEQGGAD